MYLAEIDIPPIVIYALVAMVIAAIQKVSEMAKGKGDRDATDAAESEFEDLYEEARREIIDRQTEYQEAPPLPTQERTPTVLPTPREVPAPPPLPDWQRKVSKPTLSAAEKAALARFQSQSGPKKRRSRSVSSRVRRLLSSPDSARDAIVLSEILGTPKSLQADR